jgi:hypothetical protein
MRALAVALALAFPASASAAPSVVRIDPATGTQTVLATGAPFSELSSVAVTPSGTVYAGDLNPNAGGVYALNGFAVSPFATTVPYVAPLALAATDSTVYSLDRDAGVVSLPARTVLSANPAPREGDPLDPVTLTLSGTTLYGVSPSDCAAPDSVADSSDATITAIDTTTGARSYPVDLGCTFPADLAVAADGSFLVAMPAGDRVPASIVRVRPDGKPATFVKGGLLRSPAGLALTPAGDLIVADRTSGVLRITPGGRQSVVAAGGSLNHIDGVAVDAGGAIYAVAPGGPAAVLNASAPRRQRYSASGVRVTASCAPRCSLGYSVDGKRGTTVRVGAKRSVRLKLPASVRAYMRKHKITGVVLTLRPEDGKGEAIGEPITLSVTLSR